MDKMPPPFIENYIKHSIKIMKLTQMCESVKNVERYRHSLNNKKY